MSENEKESGGLGKFKKTKKWSNFDVLKRGFLGGFSKKRGKNHDPEWSGMIRNDPEWSGIVRPKGFIFIVFLFFVFATY